MPSRAWLTNTQDKKHTRYPWLLMHNYIWLFTKRLEMWREQKYGHLNMTFHFGMISTQQRCSGAKDLSRLTHGKTKACVPFSTLPDTRGHNSILNWPNLLSQPLWNGPLQPYLSTLTATLWLDGPPASRPQHRCSSPPVTSSVNWCHVTVHWAHLSQLR